MRQRSILPVVLLSVTGLTAGGCAFVPSHPADPPVFGARTDGHKMIVKIPLCPGERISRVEVYDFNDTEHTNPRVVWSASEPTSATVRSGVFELWTGEGFARSVPRSEKDAVPSDIGVAYKDQDGHGRDSVFAPRTVENATLDPGTYWTSDGPMTAEQLDAQLPCEGGE
ncbi:hypothetical protein ACFTWD_00325 [Streptomyces sp. NPDC056943]|uniref:hypothetical protein n=1 Tax=Streptomyces sp. NPDC056943 TaxID=3345971 RepID=UPI0036370FB5